jgi:hypothetical protein
MRAYFNVAALAVLLIACSGGGGGGGRRFDLSQAGDGGDPEDLAGPPRDLAESTLDFAQPPDLAPVASCNDGLKNGKESDTDCGGGTCPKCQDFRGCLFASDCLSGMCNNNVCQPAVSCNDNIRNGNETDVDCGGGTCPKCIDGKFCVGGNDCANANCSKGICCGAARANCDGLSGNGCEADLLSDARNCSSCGVVCGINTPMCVAGQCKAAAMVLVGSYTLGQGPAWGNNPPTYTCQEACAKVFGAGTYYCSTSNLNVTRTANVDCWGDHTYCSGQTKADTYKLGNAYNCGFQDCACSAYVSDGCLNARNYCWR